MPTSSPADSLIRPAAPAVYTRRATLKLALTAATGAVVGAGALPVMSWFKAGPVVPRHQFLTMAEAELLGEVCAQLIPRDDHPGAADAGAVVYIDRQLVGPFAAHQPTYRAGLEALQLTCLQGHGRSFQALEPASKVEVLRALETGTVPKARWANPTAPAFFNLVLTHTMQSFYGSPRHGGNENFASYRMLGLALPQVVGRNRVTRS